MEIVPYQADAAEAVAAAYNRAVRGVPHCYPVGADEFASALAAAAGGTQAGEVFRAEAVFVAQDGESVAGFSHAGVARGRDDRGKQGAIRFLCYEPGRRAVGQALLEAAEAHIRSCGLDDVVTFHQNHRYPFYQLGPSYLSERLGHIAALLAFNGYERTCGEVFMDMPELRVVEAVRPEIEVEVSIARAPGRGTRPGVKAIASRGGEEIGVCVCKSGGEWARQDEAQDWAFVGWLGVEEAHQGRGVGRFLLRLALNEACALRYRHAAISTDWRNARAFLFYTNHGFTVADWTYGYARRLAAES